jgi:hypothetical protein
MDRRPFIAIQLYVIMMDLAACIGELWFHQDIIQVCRGFQLVRFQDYDKTCWGTFTNFRNSSFKARHNKKIGKRSSGSQFAGSPDRLLLPKERSPELAPDSANYPSELSGSFVNTYTS